MTVNEKRIYSKHHETTSLQGVNENMLVIGGTRSGKTTSTVFPQLLYLNDSSLIMTYSKQDEIKKYALLLTNRDYDIEYIDLQDANGSSIGFDPMEYIKTAQDIKTIAHWIIEIAKDGCPGSDHYWDDCACNLLCGEIALVFTLYEMYNDEVFCKEMELFQYEDDGPSFCDVLTIHQMLKFQEIKGSGFTATNFDSLFRLIENWSEKNDRENQALIWFNGIRGLASKTVSCVYSTLTTILEKIFTPSIKKVISHKLAKRKRNLYIERLGMTKTALFIHTSPIERSNDYFAGLLYTILFWRLLSFGEKNGGKLDIPVRIICDDFAVGSIIPDFARIISFMCSYGVSVQILLQSISQLYGRYGNCDGKTVMNNCDTIIYLGGMDIETCKDISLRTNEPMEDIMYMPIGKLWLIQRGVGAIQDDRYDLFNDELYINNIKDMT